MSNKYNDIWLGDANISFIDACEAKEVGLALDIIDRVRDEGFEGAAHAMEKVWRNHFPKGLAGNLIALCKEQQKDVFSLI